MPSPFPLAVFSVNWTSLAVKNKTINYGRYEIPRFVNIYYLIPRNVLLERVNNAGNQVQKETQNSVRRRG